MIYRLLISISSIVMLVIINFYIISLYDNSGKGDKGKKGVQGDSGKKGYAGFKGVSGLRGEIGDVGPKNDNSVKGIFGNIGEEGPKGEIGDRGNTGKKGVIGTRGIQGDIGDKGIDGEKGVPGIKGEKGDNYILELSMDETKDLLTINSNELKLQLLNHLKSVNSNGLLNKNKLNKYITGFQLKGDNDKNDKSKIFLNDIIIKSVN